jgi:hypothetical protein
MLKVGDIFQVPTPPGSIVVVGIVTQDEDAKGYVEGYQISVGMHKGNLYSLSHVAYEASKIILLAPAVEAPVLPAADAEDAEEAVLAALGETAEEGDDV